jgi:hypothetical protein
MNLARSFFGLTILCSLARPLNPHGLRPSSLTHSHMANAIIIRHRSPFMTHTLLLFILLVRVLRHTLRTQCEIDFSNVFSCLGLGVFAEVGNFDDD